MLSFEGFLDTCELIGADLQIRLAAGGFDPSPAESPVLYVRVANAAEARSTIEALERVRSVDDGVYFDELSQSEALLCSDHGTEIGLRGSSISFQAAEYEARDHHRLAVANHKWGLSLHEALKNTLAASNEARALIHSQLGRIQAKAAGHASGTTAHTLYRQHADFLQRVLATLGD